MSRVQLIHWNAAEARARAAILRDAGYTVVGKPPKSGEELNKLRTAPSDAFVIDLTRLPSHGREVALALRSFKSTRHVPLVFVEGDPEKVARIRKLLPDAHYTDWKNIAAALKRALTQPVTNPVVPQSRMAAYSSTPLPKKLGILPDSSVLLVDAPDGFEKTLGNLPKGATLKRGARSSADLVIWFVKSQKSLKGGVRRVAPLAKKGGLWIAWPKQASGVSTDLTQPVVRRIAMDRGLVDYKIAALDSTWSGLRFTQRPSKRS